MARFTVKYAVLVLVICLRFGVGLVYTVSSLKPLGIVADVKLTYDIARLLMTVPACIVSFFFIKNRLRPHHYFTGSHAGLNKGLLFFTTMFYTSYKTLRFLYTITGLLETVCASVPGYNVTAIGVNLSSTSTESALDHNACEMCADIRGSAWEVVFAGINTFVDVLLGWLFVCWILRTLQETNQSDNVYPKSGKGCTPSWWLSHLYWLPAVSALFEFLEQFCWPLVNNLDYICFSEYYLQDELSVANFFRSFLVASLLLRFFLTLASSNRSHQNHDQIDGSDHGDVSNTSSNHVALCIAFGILSLFGPTAWTALNTNELWIYCVLVIYNIMMVVLLAIVLAVIWKSNRGPISSINILAPTETDDHSGVHLNAMEMTATLLPTPEEQNPTPSNDTPSQNDIIAHVDKMHVWEYRAQWFFFIFVLVYNVGLFMSFDGPSPEIKNLALANNVLHALHGLLFLVIMLPKWQRTLTATPHRLILSITKPFVTVYAIMWIVNFVAVEHWVLQNSHKTVETTLLYICVPLAIEFEIGLAYMFYQV